MPWFSGTHSGALKWLWYREYFVQVLEWLWQPCWLPLCWPGMCSLRSVVWIPVIFIMFLVEAARWSNHKIRHHQTFSCWFCYISATEKSAQPHNLLSGFQSWSASILKSISFPPHHPPPSFPLWALVILLRSSNFSDFQWETLQASACTGSGLNRLMHLLCKLHTRACYPWRVILAWIL